MPDITEMPSQFALQSAWFRILTGTARIDERMIAGGIIDSPDSKDERRAKQAVGRS